MSKADKLLKEKQELIDELEYLKTEKIKEKARNDFVSFCEFVIKDEFSSSRIKLAELQKTWIRHIAFCKKHKLNCLILAPMSSGKCVSHDTVFIDRNKGKVLAKELIVGDTVLSYDDDEEHSCWATVSAVEEQPEKLCVLVRTKLGKSITVTADHKFLTSRGWEEAQDLVPNSSIILGPLNWDESHSEVLVDSSDLVYTTGVWAAIEDSSSQGIFENIDKIEKAYKLACDKSLQVSRYKSSQRYRKQVCQRIKNYTVRLNNSCTSDELLKCMLSVSKEMVGEFLGGYYDLNGRYARRGGGFQFFGTYQRMSDIQLLLAYVGVEAKITRQLFPENVKNKVVYKLSVLLESSYIFTKVIQSSKLKSKTLQVRAVNNTTENDTTVDYVLSTKCVGSQKTIGVQIDKTSTHVTNGLYSHNTQIIAVALPLYFLGKDPACRIKMVCLSDKAAKERLGAIRAYISSDEDYQGVFPHIKPDKNQEWTRHTIYVERNTIAKDASIDTYGVISSGIGGRCDLLIVDDIFDQRTAVSQPATREQIIATFNQVWLSRVEPSGQVVIICTRWHELDLAGDILADEGKLKRYGVLIQRVSDDMSHINCEVLVPDSVASEYQSLDPHYSGSQT